MSLIIRCGGQFHKSQLLAACASYAAPFMVPQCSFFLAGKSYHVNLSTSICLMSFSLTKKDFLTHISRYVWGGEGDKTITFFFAYPESLSKKTLKGEKGGEKVINETPRKEAKRRGHFIWHLTWVHLCRAKKKLNGVIYVVNAYVQVLKKPILNGSTSIILPLTKDLIDKASWKGPFALHIELASALIFRPTPRRKAD